MGEIGSAFARNEQVIAVTSEYGLLEVSRVETEREETLYREGHQGVYTIQDRSPASTLPL
jgi:hypothetical protein